MTADVIHDLKARVREIQLGVSLLPLGSATPEMVEAARKCNDELVKLLGLNKAVKYTTHKPTEQEIFEHRLRTGQAFFGATPAGIEPRLSPDYMRRTKG